MSDDTKFTFLLLFIVAVVTVIFGISFFLAGKEMDIAKVRCLEAGGIYTPQYGVPAICFSPDAIRGEVK